jgi:hypothetical protein
VEEMEAVLQVCVVCSPPMAPSWRPLCVLHPPPYAHLPALLPVLGCLRKEPCGVRRGERAVARLLPPRRRPRRAPSHAEPPAHACMHSALLSYRWWRGNTAPVMYRWAQAIALDGQADLIAQLLPKVSLLIASRGVPTAAAAPAEATTTYAVPARAPVLSPTPHPAPHIQHPAPCTLHPAPCTLHPAPCTLHPAPCTLHPAPHTLHRTPCAQHPAPYPTPHPSQHDATPRTSHSTRRRSPANTIPHPAPLTPCTSVAAFVRCIAVSRLFRGPRERVPPRTPSCAPSASFLGLVASPPTHTHASIPTRGAPRPSRVSDCDYDYNRDCVFVWQRRRRRRQRRPAGEALRAQHHGRHATGGGGGRHRGREAGHGGGRPWAADPWGAVRCVGAGVGGVKALVGRWGRAVLLFVVARVW